MDKTQIVSAWDVVSDYVNAFLQHLPVIGIAIAILVVAWIAAKLAKRGVRSAAGKFVDDPSLLSLFGTIAYVITIGIGVFAAAATIFPGLKAGDLIAVLGLSSVAVGFAFKDIFENFLAGVLILSRRPFKIGDFIEVQDVEGSVLDISFRSTELKTPEGEKIVMPNALLFKNPVTVLTAYESRRTTFAAGIGYGENIDEAREVIRNAVDGCDAVLKDPAPEVLCWSHDASAVAFKVRYWSGPQNSEVAHARDQVATAIKNGLDEAEIEIPYPHVTLDYPLEERLPKSLVA